MHNPGVNWVQQAVASFQPQQNQITLSNGDIYSYDYLIVNPGLELRFDLIAGSKEALDDKDAPVSTIYTVGGAYKTAALRESFKRGKALYHSPQFPIKCGGAPLKIMFLSEETFRKNGVRDNVQIHYYAATGNFFPPCKKFADALVPIAGSKGISPHFGHQLTKIDKDKRVATFKTADGEVSESFDLLHFVPPQSAPAFVRNSELAAANGFVDVNMRSL